MSSRSFIVTLCVSGSLAALAPIAFAGEALESVTMRAEVSGLVAKRDYAALDRLEKRLLTNERFADGTLKLSTFTGQVQQAIRQIDLRQCGQGEIAYAQSWLRRATRSAQAIDLEAHGIIAEAWCIRGSGYASQVAPAAWPVFYAKLAEADTFLDAHKQQGADDPLWYEDKLTVANALDVPEKEFESLSEASLNRFPTSYEIASRIFTYHLPKWHGDWSAADRAAKRVSRYGSSPNSRALYARLYWSELSATASPLIDNTQIDWLAMRASMRALATAFPDAWNLESFARLSCKNRDYSGSLFFFRMLPSQAAMTDVSRPWLDGSERASCLNAAITVSLAGRRGPDGRLIPLPRPLPPAKDVELVDFPPPEPQAPAQSPLSDHNLLTARALKLAPQPS